jgi:hypothetical protein
MDISCDTKLDPDSYGVESEVAIWVKPGVLIKNKNKSRLAWASEKRVILPAGIPCDW